MWLLSTGEATVEPLADQIARLLASVTDDFAVWGSLTARFSGTVFCGFFADLECDGLHLPPRLMADIGARGLALDLCVYDSVGNEE